MKKDKKSVLSFKKSKVASLKDVQSVKGGDGIEGEFTTHDPQAGIPRCILTSRIIVTKII